jgi:hypothetical protein
MAIKRIITCQGTAQLVSAVAAMACRHGQESLSKSSDENYLVIYGLYAPDNQLELFVQTIKLIANRLAAWRGQIYFDKQRLPVSKQKLQAFANARAFREIRNDIGAKRISEIYLVRTWQPENHFLANVYPRATRICFGDGLGLYFSRDYSRRVFENSLPSPDLRRKPPQQKHRSIYQRLTSRLSHKRLRDRSLDFGYFLAPEALGETPPMAFQQIPPATFLTLLTQAAGLLDPKHRDHILKLTTNHDVVVLLTSNFTEAARMTLDNELVAYAELLKKIRFGQSSILIIKPHPRDDRQKIITLAEQLRVLYADVVALLQPEFFFIPFESFLLATFFSLEDDQRPPIRIVATSTAAISLHRLFGITPDIGFGAELVKKYFCPAYVAGRLAHEADLRNAVNESAAGGASTFSA